MINKIYQFLTLLFLSFNLHAQTVISDTIVGGDTSWTKANSPYIIGNGLAVFTGVTLTIEPGTQIKFTGIEGISVLGSIILKGTQSDSIIFYRDSLSFNPNEQPMIYFADTASISYCSFRNSYTGAVTFASTVPGTSTIQNCSFLNNYYVIGLHGEPEMNIKFANCTFNNNQTVLPYLNATVNNCTFSGNTIAINQVNKVHNSAFLNNTVAIANADTIMNCIFIGNTTAIGDSAAFTPRLTGLRNGIQNNQPTVSSITADINTQVFAGNLITGNNTGISLYSSYFNIQNNIITGNEIGIEITADIGANNTSSLENNTICNNSKYNLALTSSTSFSFPNNCWCSTDSAYIRSTIYDGFVNPSYGQIDYTPLTNCPTTTIDTIFGSTNYYVTNKSYKFYIDSVANATYKWIIDGDTVSTEGSVTANWDNAGLHTVTCIVYDGGIPISSYTLPIDAYTNPLAVVPSTSSLVVSVYPNPNNGEFTIVSPLVNVQLSIYNSLGTTIQTIQLIEHQTVVNLSNVVPGIYYLVIELDERNFNQKIIVE